MAGKWEKEADNIRRMTEAGLSDPEIAAKYGVSDQVIWHARKQLGIPSGVPQGGWHGNRLPFEQDTQVTPVNAYEENGITVKVYPPMWANGASRDHTTRPIKRGKRAEG